LYHKYSYDQGFLRANSSDHNQVFTTAKSISDILVNNLTNSNVVARKLWFDSDACYRIVQGYISGKYRAKFCPETKEERNGPLRWQKMQ
jgi:hypothetical protein